MLGAVWDGKKNVKEIVAPTPHNLAAFKHRLLILVKELAEGRNLQSVGVGIAGLVDKKHGVVKSSPNLKFLKNFKIKKFLLGSGFSAVSVDNDAACFTLAELKLGAGKKYKNFLCMTLGTGIGGGIVIGRQPYRGYENFGAEFGKMFLENGQLEPQFQKARIKRDYEKIGELLGQACANLISMFNPEAIVFGGSVVESYKKFKKPLEKYLKARLKPARSKAVFLVSKIKNAGAVGAALLLRSKQ